MTHPTSGSHTHSCDKPGCFFCERMGKDTDIDAPEYTDIITNTEYVRRLKNAEAQKRFRDKGK